MDSKKNQRECGAIIIEASIALTTFMFAIVSILFVSHICYAQAKIGTVIDGVAKDLSEFSYVYSLTGLADKHSKIREESAKATKSIDNVVDNLNDVTDTLCNIKTLGSDLINDSEMQSSMISLLKNEAINKVESMATALIVQKLAKSRLAGVNADCENVLRNLGVEKKSSKYLNSIDFGDSVFCVNGSAEIKVVANYSVKLIKLLNMDITYDICQCASTKAWGAAPKTNAEVAESQNDTNESDSEKTNDSESEAEVSLKSADELAKEFTKNPTSDKVVLGTGTKLITDAEYIGATYFVMGDNYNGNYDEWEIKKKYLEQNKTKTFYINTDPSKVTNSTLKREIIWLQDHGYLFKQNALGYWEAKKQ